MATTRALPAARPALHRTTLVAGVAWTLLVVGGFALWATLVRGPVARVGTPAEFVEVFLGRSGGRAAGVVADAAANLSQPVYLLFERTGPDAVRAARAGRVDFAGEVDGFGRVVVVVQDDGLTTTYAHLGELAAREGARVAAGEQIGTAGPGGALGEFIVRFEVSSDSKVAAPVAVFGDADPTAVLFGDR